MVLLLVSYSECPSRALQRTIETAKQGTKNQTLAAPEVEAAPPPATEVETAPAPATEVDRYREAMVRRNIRRENRRKKEQWNKRRRGGRRWTFKHN